MGRQSLLRESVDTTESINTFDFVAGLDMAVIDKTAMNSARRSVPEVYHLRPLPVTFPSSHPPFEEQEKPRASGRSNRVGTIIFLAVGKEQ